MGYPYHFQMEFSISDHCALTAMLFASEIRWKSYKVYSFSYVCPFDFYGPAFASKLLRNIGKGTSIYD